LKAGKAFERVEQGDLLVEIDGVSGKLEVLAPFAGQVEEINERAEREPERVTDDPLEEGWLVKFRIRPEKAGEKNT
jgi:glycine cleavage system H lipoate-binding protein